MALCPSSVPLRVPLPPPPESSLPAVPDPESYLARAASPTVSRLLPTAVSDPTFESTVASALVAELVDFAAAYCLDHATSLVAESKSGCPPSVGGECALGTDVLKDRTSLAALGFAPLTADPSLFLRTDTSLPPLYVLVYIDDLVFATIDTEALALVKSELQKRHTYTDLAPPSDESVEPSGSYPELVGCLMVLRYLCSTSGMGLVLGGRGPVVLTGHAYASWVDEFATQRSSQGYTFSLGSDSVSWQSTRSCSVLSSSCEAEIYAWAMAAQELRWLTYLLTDLGERPRSSPVLYVDNKAMIALCQEHGLEHRTKHIALQYFLARELQ
ncbi:unnamed protein product [Closterium sp. NIES-54]